jgi:hypothetical protein
MAGGLTSMGSHGSSESAAYKEFTDKAVGGTSIDQVVNQEIDEIVRLDALLKAKLKKVASVLPQLSADDLGKLELFKAQKVVAFQELISGITDTLSGRSESGENRRKAGIINHVFVKNKHVRGKVKDKSTDDQAPSFASVSGLAKGLEKLALKSQDAEHGSGSDTEEEDQISSLPAAPPHPAGAPAKKPPLAKRGSQRLIGSGSSTPFQDGGKTPQRDAPHNLKHLNVGSRAQTPLQAAGSVSKTPNGLHNRSRTLEDLSKFAPGGSLSEWATGIVTPADTPLAKQVPSGSMLMRGSSFSAKSRSRASSRARGALPGVSFDTSFSDDSPKTGSLPGHNRHKSFGEDASPAGAGTSKREKPSRARNADFQWPIKPLAFDPLTPPKGGARSRAETPSGERISNHCRDILNLMTEQYGISDEEDQQILEVCLKLFAQLKQQEGMQVFSSLSLDQMLPFVGLVDKNHQQALVEEITTTATLLPSIEFTALLQDLARKAKTVEGEQQKAYEMLIVELTERAKPIKEARKKTASAAAFALLGKGPAKAEAEPEELDLREPEPEVVSQAKVALQSISEAPLQSVRRGSTVAATMIGAGVGVALEDVTLREKDADKTASQVFAEPDEPAMDAPQEEGVLDADSMLELLGAKSLEPAQLEKCIAWLNADANAEVDAKSIFKLLSWEKLLPLVGLVEKHEKALFDAMKVKGQRLIKEGNAYITKNLQDVIQAGSSTGKQKDFCTRLLAELEPKKAVSAAW